MHQIVEIMRTVHDKTGGKDYGEYGKNGKYEKDEEDSPVHGFGSYGSSDI